MSATVRDLAARRPHRVAFARCRPCGRTWVDVAPVGVDDGGLECPGCGAQDSEASATPFAAVVPLRRPEGR